MDIVTGFRRNLSILVFLTFDLMVLGAGVRAMDAGLTCPDWPLCFGRIVPAFHWGVYLEFIHRAIAGLVALFFLYLLVTCFRRDEFTRIRSAMTVAGMLLLSQIIMGGVTVLNLLASWTVTTHLTLATTFLAILIYIRFQLVEKSEDNAPRPLETLHWLQQGTRFSLFLVCGQMILGGLVASTYAGLICVDFPTCNGQWFPPLLGPVGLQVMHRIGAVILVIVLSTLYFCTRWYWQKGWVDREQYLSVLGAFILIYCQFLVGVLNLKFLLPVPLTVLHSAFAIIIFILLFKAMLVANRQFKTQLVLVQIQ